jgi:hypothetical protein
MASGGEQNSIGVKLDFDTKSMRAVPDEAKKMMARLEQVIADRPGGAFGGALSAMLGSSKGKENIQAYKKAQAELRAHYAQQVNDTRKFYEDMQRLRAKELADLKAQTNLSYQEILRVQKLEAEGPAMARRDRARAAQQLRGIRSEQAMSMADLDRLRYSGATAPEEHTRGLRGFLGGLETGAGITRFGARAIGAIAGYKLAQAGRAAIVRDQERYGLALRTGGVGDIYNTHGAFANRSSRLLNPDQDIAMRGQWAGIAGVGGLGEVGAASEWGMGMGIGAGAGVQGMATLKRAGAVGGEQDQRRFAALLGEAVVQAQMRGREGEMLQAVISMTESVMRTSLNGPSVTDTRSLITRLAMTGEPGARGELGMRILGGANAAMQGIEYIPGIRGMGQNMVAQTARGILAQSGIGPFEAQGVLNQGITAKVPGTEKLLLDEILDRLNPQSSAMKLAVTGGFGLSADQGKAFLAMRGKRAGGLLTPEMEAEWMAHPSRSGAYEAALEKGGGLVEFKKISATAPAGEAKIEGMASAAEMADKAFRETLIPTVDVLAQGFVSIIDSFGGVAAVGTALKDIGLALAAFKVASSVGTVARGVGAAAGVARGLAGVGVGAAVGSMGLLGAASAVGAVGLGSFELMRATGLDKTVADYWVPATGGGTGPGAIMPDELQGIDPKVLQMFTKMPQATRDLIVSEARKNGVPLRVALATIYQESGGNPSAVNVNKGKNGRTSTDRGLMQLNDLSHPGMTVGQMFDPETNVRMGMQQLGAGIKKYGLEGGISAYNQGEGNYQKYGAGGNAAYVQRVEGLAHVIVDVNVTDGEGKKGSTKVVAKAPLSSTDSPMAER